jgi:5-methylcytosine-specific restriction endonuclease McrA
MARDFAKAFYNSAAWQHCRDAYIEHVHGLCERCHRPGWIVHHKCYLSPANIEDPDVTLNFDNLEYLCQDCHNLEHGSVDHKSVKDGLYFDENGDLRQVKAPPFEN